MTPLGDRGWGAFDELAEIAENFDLILDVNAPDARRDALWRRPRATSAVLPASSSQWAACPARSTRRSSRPVPDAGLSVRAGHDGPPAGGRGPAHVLLGRLSLRHCVDAVVDGAADRSNRPRAVANRPAALRAGSDARRRRAAAGVLPVSARTRSRCFKSNGCSSG